MKTGWIIWIVTLVITVGTTATTLSKKVTDMKDDVDLIVQMGDMSRLKWRHKTISFLVENIGEDPVYSPIHVVWKIYRHGKLVEDGNDIVYLKDGFEMESCRAIWKFTYPTIVKIYCEVDPFNEIKETREDNNKVCYCFIYTGHSVYKIPCGKAVNNIQNHRTNLVKFNQFFGHLLQKFPVQH